jgi:hypothetical protein
LLDLHGSDRAFGDVVGGAPGVQDGGEVGVAGVPVPDQDLPGAQFGQDTASVDRVRGPVPGVQQCQVVGARSLGRGVPCAPGLRDHH